MSNSQKFMQSAIDLAKEGIFSCRPNPRVGCVLVKDNKIIGQGFHHKTGEDNAEKKIAEFIHYLPILHYGGISLTQISAHEVLEMAMSGTNSTLLARRWSHHKLVNVDNELSLIHI